jgi:hypothetical protein
MSAHRHMIPQLAANELESWSHIVGPLVLRAEHGADPLAIATEQQFELMGVTLGKAIAYSRLSMLGVDVSSIGIPVVAVSTATFEALRELHRMADLVVLDAESSSSNASHLLADLFDALSADGIGYPQPA